MRGYVRYYCLFIDFIILYIINTRQRTCAMSSNLPPYKQINWELDGLAASSADTGSPAYWEGTVGDAVNELRDTIAHNRSFDLVALHPLRITATVLNRMISLNDNSPERPQILSNLMQLSKDIFGGKATPDQIDEFAEMNFRQGFCQLVIDQYIDESTITATNPEFALRAANRLKQVARPEEKFTMVALGNSGTTAAILTTLEYKDMTGVDIPVYPVRFSTNKLGDKQPQSAPVEQTYLTQQSVNKTLVVCDEDTYTGNGIHTAIGHFRSMGIATKFLGMAVQDLRPERTRTEQGEWWQHAL